MRSVRPGSGVDADLAQLPERTRRAVDVAARAAGAPATDLVQALCAEGLSPADLELAEQRGIVSYDGGRVVVGTVVTAAAVATSATAPTEREPADPRLRRVPAAALAALSAGHMSEAVRLLDDSLSSTRDAIDRARIVHVRGRLAFWGGPAAPSVISELETAAEAVLTEAADLAALMLADAALLRGYSRDTDAAVATARRAVEVGHDVGVSAEVARATYGVTLVLAGRAQDGLPLLGSYRTLLAADLPLTDVAHVLQHVVMGLFAVERYDEAASLSARLVGAARSLGAVGLLPAPLCLLANSAWWSGDWNTAQLSAAEARELARAADQPVLELYACAMLALVAAGRAQEDRCRAWLQRVAELTETTGIQAFVDRMHLAEGMLEIGSGRPANAVAALRVLKEKLAAEPGSGLLHWRAELVEALVEAGDLDAARAELTAARRDLPPSRWEKAALGRCSGLLATDEGTAHAELSAAVDAWRGHHPFEEARTRLALAAHLVAHDRPGAAAEAERAAELFEQVGAQLWAERARAVLPGQTKAVSARPQPRSFELQLLGGFCVRQAGSLLPVPAGVGQQAIKLVALNGGRLGVDTLVETLWPDAAPGRGRSRLRNVLNRLRRDAGELLVRDGDDVRLADAAVDVWTFEAAVDAAARASGPAGTRAAEAAVALYAGELLPGDRFEDWSSGPRELLRGKYLSLLDRLAAEAGTAGDVEGASRWFEMAVGVDPYDEERYVAMARLLLATSRRAPAMRVARRCAAMLDELGLEHSSALVELLGDKTD